MVSPHERQRPLLSKSEGRMNERLRLLEAFYRFDLDEHAHIRAIQEAAAGHWEKRRPVAMMTSHSTLGAGFQTEFYVSRGDRSDYVTAARGVLPQVSEAEMLQYLSTVDFYGSTSEARQQRQFDSRGSQRSLEHVGVCDVVGFCCGTGEGGRRDARSAITGSGGDHLARARLLAPGGVPPCRGVAAAPAHVRGVRGGGPGRCGVSA